MDTAELARRLPDVPRWLEARSMLLNGTGEVLGAGEDGFVPVHEMVVFHPRGAESSAG